MKYAFPLALLLLVASTTIQAADAPPTKPTIGRLPVGRVLFLGNSITKHGPAPAIGWTEDWGMAASAREKDYVQLLTSHLAKTAGAQPKTMVRNIADFERGYETFGIEKEFKEELAFQADLVIIAIGENVSEPSTDESRKKFAEAFARLLSALKQHGNPAIFVRSSFWQNPVKDNIMRRASEDAGATYVDISRLGADKSHMASSERKIEHPGVGGHPGDKGMKAIADEIFAAIRRTGGIAANP
ncbi:MAG: SGNH/GDSL hydrolase family protein [Planctomycetota bacterium]